MRNLKKVLSLVLCVAVMLSVMVVGAGAAFSDQSKIQNTEAVDACVALNIINGYDDGTYRPANNITRAEACKMICVALNGGREPNVASAATPTFNDVRTDKNSAWAEGYIESCVAQGIVAGTAPGKFEPSNNVTGSQMAKMLLVALGYNAVTEKFNGSNWDTFVNTMASSKGLYEGLESIDVSAALTRDSAAQMVWNALNAYEVEYTTTLVTNANGQLSTYVTVQDKVVGSNDDKISLLEDKYEAKAITGTLVSVKQDNGKDTYNITVDDPMYNGGKYNNLTTISWTDITKDYSNLLFQNVRVLVKPDKNGKDAVVYGVYPTNKNTVQSGILKNLKMDGSKVKLDGVKYDLANDTSVYVNGVKVTDTSYDTISEWVSAYGDGASYKYSNHAYFQPTEVELLAIDGTSNYSILKVKTYAVAKVSSVGSDYVNLTYKEGDPSIITSTKCEADDWDYYKGIAKNDYVIVSDAGNYASGNGLIEKATVVSGKVDGTRSTDGVSIDNTWYTMAGRVVTGDGAYNSLVKRPNTGANVEMVLVNGYVYYTDTTAGSIDDMALLVEAAPSGGVNSKWEGRLIFADGSDKVVTIEKKWDDKDDGAAIQEFHEGTATNPNIALSGGGANVYAAPMLVSYEVSNNVYTLTRMGLANTDTTDTTKETNGYDTYISAESGTTDGSIKATLTSTDGASVSRLYYESTGIVFVKYDDKAQKDGATGYATNESDASYKVVSGKTASDYDRTLSAVQAVADKSGNNYYAQAAFIDLGNSSTGGNSDNYAVVIANVEKRTGTANGTVYVIKAWNGSETITVTTDDSAANSLKKGSIFSYTGTGDTLADIDTFSSAKEGNYYVQAFDATSGDITLKSKSESTSDNTVTFTGTNTADAWTVVDSKDTTVLFVNSDAGEGVTGYDLDDITLSFVFDEDYWSLGYVPENFKLVDGVLVDADKEANKLTEDFAPSVRVYVDNDSDDQITVLVVDINRNITEW